jgi:hypothetical protein
LRRWSILTALTITLGGVVYLRVASGKLNLTTGLLLIAALWVGLVTLADLVSIADALAPHRNRLRLLAITVGVLLLGSELFSCTGGGRTRSVCPRAT